MMELKKCFNTAILLLSTVALSNCAAPTYHRLSSENDIPILGPGKAATTAAGKRTHIMPVTWRNYQSKIAIHELGTGHRNQVLVLLHGGFSDHETWRFVSGNLSQYYDLILVDFPGCGASDHPPLWRTPDDFFSPQAMAEMTLQAVNQRLKLRRTYPKKIALVGHSLGGTVALQMFHNEVRPLHPHLMSHVNQLVLFSPMDLALSEPLPALEKLNKARAWQIHLANSTGILREMGAKAMEQSMYDPGNAPREEVDRGIEILVDRGLRSGAQANLEQAFHWKDDGSPDWAYINHRSSAYRNVEEPVLIVWGAQDETLPVSMGRRISSQIRGSRLLIIKDAKHSFHFEYPNRTLELIRSTIR